MSDRDLFKQTVHSDSDTESEEASEFGLTQQGEFEESQKQEFDSDTEVETESESGSQPGQFTQDIAAIVARHKFKPQPQAQAQVFLFH